MVSSSFNPWLNRLAILTAVATLGLIAIGGLVTSHGAGMAVPDWPTTYGYNMFFFPISNWVGGVFYEHTHRLWASVVGLLTAVLSGWIWTRESTGVARWIGLGGIVLTLGLMGVRMPAMFVALGAVALLVIVLSFIRMTKEQRPLRWAAAMAFAAVLVQGVLGGLRVTLMKDQIGIVHGTLAQLFLVLVSLIALFTSRFWIARSSAAHPAHAALRALPLPEAADGSVASLNSARSSTLRGFLALATAMVLGQLIVGATMRHQHAGLAVPDFPLAYGNWWPPMDDASLAIINQRRLDTRDFKPITAFHIGLHMAHRIGALLALGAAGLFAWRARKELGAKAGLTRLGRVWLSLLLVQAGLGAATVLSNKAADIATAHVMVGALSLVCGGVLWAMTHAAVVARRDVAATTRHFTTPAPSLAQAEPVSGAIYS